MPEYDAVGTVAFFRERHRVESATTRRVLEALSPADLSYSPHPRSSSAGTIAWTVVRGLRVCRELLQERSAAVSQESHPDLATLMAEFQSASESIAAGVLHLPQQAWMEERTVMPNGAVIHHEPLGQILWLFHCDAIHHRGQLSTYLRPMGAGVPSIYGPSGDESFHTEHKESL